jgi:hypothetical protein
MSFLGSFDHTSATSWGGSQISPTLFTFITIVGGFFAVDHILLRSPRTAALKVFVNLFAFGFWWIYDIVQTFAEWDSVNKYGLSVPFFGPTGLGAGIFHGTGSAAPDTAPSPIFFLLYVGFLSLPFGLSHFAAGDFMGGLAMLLFTISGILTVFSLLWTTYSALYLLYDTKSLFIDGTPRFFPSTIYMNSTGAAGNVMTPSAFEKMKSDQSLFSIITGPFAPFLGPIRAALGLVVDTKCAVEKVIPPVIDAVQKTIPPAVAAVKSTVALAEKAPQLLSATDSISAFTDPAALRAAAGQKGGATGAVGALEAAGNLSSYVFFGTAVIVLVGALTLTWARFTPSNKTSKEENTNDVPPDVHNDTPPGS